VGMRIAGISQVAVHSWSVLNLSGQWMIIIMSVHLQWGLRWVGSGERMVIESCFVVNQCPGQLLLRSLYSDLTISKGNMY